MLLFLLLCISKAVVCMFVLYIFNNVAYRRGLPPSRCSPDCQDSLQPTLIKCTVVVELCRRGALALNSTSPVRALPGIWRFEKISLVSDFTTMHLLGLF